MLVWSSMTVTAAVPRPRQPGLRRLSKSSGVSSSSAESRPMLIPPGTAALAFRPFQTPAGVLVDQLAAGDAQRQLDADLLVDVPRDAVELRPVALGRADRLEPVGPALDDVRDAAERLDVVDDRRLAERPLDRRERRLDPRPAPLPFEALDQPGLLAADVRPGPPVAVDLQVEARPVDVLAQVPRRASPRRSPAPGSGRR